MDADGTNPQIVVNEEDIRVSEPAWSPDGEFIIAQRKKNSNRNISMGLWRYSLGGAEPTLVVEGRTGGPSISPDGSTLYYHDHDARNMKAISVIDNYFVAALSLEESEDSREPVEVLRGVTGPTISPNGQYLAFGRRLPGEYLDYKGIKHGPRNSLWVKTLATEEERMLLDPIERDITETDDELLQASRALPAMAWSADSEAIYISQHGRIVRVQVKDATVSQVPFTAVVDRQLSEMTRASIELDLEGPVRSRYLRWARRSPVGTTVAVQALGRIWLYDLADPSAGARRMTPDDDRNAFQHAPTWSPDGQYLAYTERAEDNTNSLWRINVESGEAEQLMRITDLLVNTSWSPDGKSILFVVTPERLDQGIPPYYAPGRTIFRIPAEGGAPERLKRVDRAPRSRALPTVHQHQDGKIYYTRDTYFGRDVFTDFMRLDPVTGEAEPLVRTAYADRAVLSPDGRLIAFEKNTDIFLLPVADIPKPGAFVELRQSKGAPDAVRARRVSPNGGIDPHWLPNGTLEFVAASTYYQYDPQSGDIQSSSIAVEQPRANRKDFAVTGARLITLENREIVEQGSLVVKGGRLACVGDCDLSGTERIYDATGKTIMPGIVDMHNSVTSLWGRVTPHTNIRMMADFASGVTTGFSPSDWGDPYFAQGEMVEAGLITGPRLMSGADKLRWDFEPYYVELASLDDARHELRKRKSFGAVASKQYLRERNRKERQMVAAAAAELGLATTSHLTKGNLSHGLSLVLDGYTGTQHIPVQVPFYHDMTTFYGMAGFTHNMTLGVAGGVSNENFFLAQIKLDEDERLLRYMPEALLQPAPPARLRPKAEYAFAIQAMGMREMVEKGGFAAIGSHGQWPGYSPHLEIQILAEAMDPIMALESATLHGARFLGLEDEIGSLKAGKVADFVVLNGNPLEDIRETRNTHMVVKGGVAYDALTLDKWPPAIR